MSQWLIQGNRGRGRSVWFDDRAEVAQRFVDDVAKAPSLWLPRPRLLEASETSSGR